MQTFTIGSSHIATAKAKINNKMHYFFSGARQSRTDAMNRIFTLINPQKELA